MRHTKTLILPLQMKQMKPDFPACRLRDEDSVYSRENFLESLVVVKFGTRVNKDLFDKTCLNVTATAHSRENLFENLVVVIMKSPISSALGGQTSPPPLDRRG